MVVDLTLDDVINIHSEIQRKFNITLGIKDKGLLESIVQRPNFSPYKHVPFRSVYAKCASLVEGIIKWHPFIDGNKRTGLVVAFTYMRKNGYYVMLPVSAVRFSVLIAQDKKDIHNITNWIRSITAKDYETFRNKLLKQTLNRYRRVIDMYHSGFEDKAMEIIDKWLACDIYPEYRSQDIETLDFIIDLLEQYSNELIEERKEKKRKNKA